MSTLNRDLPLNPTREQPQARWRVWAARWGWVFAAAIIPFILYFFTMAPTVYGLDSAELTTGAYTLGIVHPPGSPLFLLIGHLFTWLPFGDVGWRVNLFSVVSGTVMAGFLYLILVQVVRGRWLALTATWLCTFSYFIWINTLATELYALQLAWLSGLLWLALRWRTTPRPWQLPLFTFLFGLGLGNHLSLVLLVPGFVVLLFVRTPQESGELGGTQSVVSRKQSLIHRLPFTVYHSPLTLRSLIMAAATGLLGTLIYLYLPIRYLAPDNLNYARDYWGIDLTTWHGFWWMVSGRIFGSLFLGVPWQQWPGELLAFFSQLFSNYWGLGFLLGLGGLFSDFRRRPVLHLALLLMFTFHLGFYMTYRVVDKQFMYGPAYLIWAIWLAIGAQRLHEWLTADRATRREGDTAKEYRVAVSPRPHVAASPSRQWQPLVPLLMGFLVVAALAINLPLVNVSQDWTAREQGEMILTTLPEEAVFYGTWLDVPILEYLQRVEGQRPDVVARNLVFIGRGRAPLEATQRLDAGQTLYTSNRKWFSEGNFEFIRVEACQCYRVVRED